jgi:hypothetical protein
VNDQWRASAACAGRETRWWFTPAEDDWFAAGLAARICQGCPVQRDCAGEAVRLVAAGQAVYGLWAGVWMTGTTASLVRLKRRAGVE